MAAAAKSTAPVALVFGDDDFAVKQRSREIYQQWIEELGGMDHELIDAAVTNSDQAVRALGKLREALQTLPFFGGGKVIWLQNCSFLADDRTSSSDLVTETLAEVAQELKEFSWQNVRLLISAPKVDKRKVFFKALDKLGKVESFEAWTVNDKDWARQAEIWANKGLRATNKIISDVALAELINLTGPNARQLEMEVEKLSLYVGDRREINVGDVSAISSRNKLSRSYALADALGDRKLPELLKCLDENLWEIRSKIDKDKSVIGLLYGLIGKVRSMLMLKEMVREGWVKPVADFNRFKAQLDGVPAQLLPTDKKFNPLALNPYILFRALSQIANYTQAELIRAMDLLLQCNMKLVTTRLDNSLVLQQTLVQIAGRTAK